MNPCFLLLLVLASSSQLHAAGPEPEQVSGPAAEDRAATGIDPSHGHHRSWLADFKQYPEVSQERGQIYNRIFRYRGELSNMHEAYELWFECLFAAVAPRLENGPALTNAGNNFCKRLEHRIAKEQFARLAPTLEPDLETGEHSTVSKVTADTKLKVLESVPTRDTFLDLYSLKTDPVLMLGLGGRMVTDTGLLLKNCLKGVTFLEPGSSEVSIHHQCSDFLLETFHVPDFASQDVLQVMHSKFHAPEQEPIELDKESTQESGLHGQNGLVSLGAHWPTIWHNDAKSCAQGPKQAPGGAHLIIAPIQGASLSVHVSAPQNHHAYEHVVTSGGDRRYRRLQTSSETRSISDSTISVNVAYPDALFLPSGSIYSWVCDGMPDNEHDTFILTHGFVDAGALTHFINEVSLDSAQNPDAYQPEYVRHVLNMHGKRAPFSLNTAGSSAGSINGTVPWSVFKSGDNKPVPKKQMSNHRVWRMRKLWEKKLLSIVPPKPKSVRVMYSGWEVVQLEISIPMAEASSFKSVHKGFMLSWSMLNNATTILSPNATGSHLMTMDGHCHASKSEPTSDTAEQTIYVCTCRVLRPSSVYALRVAIATGSSIGPNSEPVAVKTKTLSVPPAMRAPRSCGVRVRMVKEGTPSMFTPSHLGHVAHANMMSLYACIEMDLPMDNGGRPIQEVLVRWQRVGKHHMVTHDPYIFHVNGNITGIAEGHEHPSVLKKYINNIIPNARLMFSVATRSSLGTSAWSPELIIDTEVQVSKEGPFVVHAPVVDFDYRDPVDPLAEDRNRSSILLSNQLNTDAPVVIISTARHSVILVDDTASNTRDIQAWGLHFSPSTYDVRGLLVMGDPIDGNEPLRNADEVRGNIVLIERGGGYPFRDKVLHAQRAGAIGVIFMDHGQCDTQWTQGCVPGASRHNGDGFALQDAESAWEGLDTPAVIVTKEHGELLISEMGSPLM